MITAHLSWKELFKLFRGHLKMILPQKTVAISFLGTVLDKGFNQERWLKWRPNVAMNQRQDFHLDRMELFMRRNTANWQIM